MLTLIAMCKNTLYCFPTVVRLVCKLRVNIFIFNPSLELVKPVERNFLYISQVNPFANGSAFVTIWVIMRVIRTHRNDPGRFNLSYHPWVKIFLISKENYMAVEYFIIPTFLRLYFDNRWIIIYYQDNVIIEWMNNLFYWTSKFMTRKLLWNFSW